MFGCIGRLIVLAVLIALGATAYVTRNHWEPAVRAKLGMRPPRRPLPITWDPITPAGAARARATLDSLNGPTGPAFVNVGAGDLVAYALEPIVRQIASAQPPGEPAAARSVDNLLLVRGHVRVADLGGEAALGALAGVLEGTQRIEIRGRVEVAQPGRASFVVTRIALGELALPGPLIGRLVQLIAPRTDKTTADEAVALALPAGIADVRLARGRVTLYKGGP